MDSFQELVQGLVTAQVRFVVIGVWGANYYAPSSAVAFQTEDRDLFLPLDPDNLVRAWSVCDATGRDKDRLFLATHKQALEDLLKKQQ